MLAWLSGLAVTLLSGIIATLYLWLFRRRSDELAAGLKALSALRWREFSRLVLAAMASRGLHPINPQQDESREPQSSFMLAKDGKRWLLACKHGSAYRIGAAPVVELASNIRLRSAAGGILATEGHVEKEGRDAAQNNHIEVLDGPRLWPEVKSLLDEPLRESTVGAAATRAKRHIAIAWLAAVAIGLLVAVTLASRMPAERQAAAPVGNALPAAAAPPAPDAPAPALVEATEEEIEGQRLAVSKALARAPGIKRGVWQTKLTLSVDRVASEAEVWPIICQQVELYPDLRTVRIQLNPPPGSDEPTRWRQCKTM
ncbi:restriction endonuclease [Pseudoxanthomonas wuyuanensis]|uniref:Restriction endonuclease n=1 Tax=Pseudoxanthomonas wuyuanensis TaxID=1073196 RepID=A0A286CZX9_9GAMM|nr:restriction endonuclease [Pseudoxanthomonas wuyuanensis]KAF1722406.1 hypothetical protein CSC75_04045 [Pseudoxanthomonas wuyuanensis]SOD51919.1 Restriction endonuclease [Pseudoxanthomonas wuyuanensis]